jgi:hypothetical protein
MNVDKLRKRSKVAFMPNIPAANTAPARTVPDSTLPNGPTLRRSLDQYANCTPAAVSGGSQAQMAYFVEDAKHDIAALVQALREAEKVIRLGLLLISEERGWGTYPRMEGSEIYQDATEFDDAARAFLKTGGAS